MPQLAFWGPSADVMAGAGECQRRFPGLLPQCCGEAWVTTTVEMGLRAVRFGRWKTNIRSQLGRCPVRPITSLLVPEYRGVASARSARNRVAGLSPRHGQRRAPAAAPVLPRVKFFTDGAFYSQTMRLFRRQDTCRGQSDRAVKAFGLMRPDESTDEYSPMGPAVLAVNIHSMGDAAQGAIAYGAEKHCRNGGGNNSFTIEHGGLFSPHQVD